MWVPVSHSSDHCALRVQLESQTDIRLLRVLNAVPNIWALIYAREQPSQVYILERGIIFCNELSPTQRCGANNYRKQK